ncbi:MAG TPA: DUF6644 family protein [Bryobacteraceae bacterium]|nr:DUF6644 family protein [Bryobacteraceae bacterium]
MLLALLQWIQNTGVFAYLRSSAYLYPVILALHLSAISLFGGMIVVTNLSLLGWIPRQIAPAAVIDGLRVPKRVGLIIAATFGLLLFCCKAEQYYYNTYFRAKLLLFALVAVHALVFRSRGYKRSSEAIQAQPPNPQSRLGAALSLLLWAGILTAGRAIGYVPAPPGLHFL